MGSRCYARNICRRRLRWFPEPSCNLLLLPLSQATLETISHLLRRPSPRRFRRIRSRLCQLHQRNQPSRRPRNPHRTPFKNGYRGHLLHISTSILDESESILQRVYCQHDSDVRHFRSQGRFESGSNGEDWCRNAVPTRIIFLDFRTRCLFWVRSLLSITNKSQLLILFCRWETGYAINLARDFGPRLMSYILGYGHEVWSAGGYYFWIPMVAPFLGCTFGAFLYDFFIYTGPESPVNTPWLGLKDLVTQPWRSKRKQKKYEV